MQVVPLGGQGPDAKALEAAASLVTNCFFVSMFDCHQRPKPSEKDLEKLQKQVGEKTFYLF